MVVVPSNPITAQTMTRANLPRFIAVPHTASRSSSYGQTTPWPSPVGRLISCGGPITVDEFCGKDHGLLGKGRALARQRGSRIPRYWVFAALLLSAWLQIDAAAAGGPAAVVEETDAPSLRLQAMDYVVE